MAAPRKNICLAQRHVMVEYMEENPSLISGKFNCPNSEELKEMHWGRLVEKLNSVGGGAVKDKAKWQKSWSDWKSDVKIKAGKINARARGTGGGEAAPPLSELEAKLIALVGSQAVEGLTNIRDPLESQLVLAGSSASHQSKPTKANSSDVEMESLEENVDDPEGVMEPPEKQPSANNTLESQKNHIKVCKVDPSDRVGRKRKDSRIMEDDEVVRAMKACEESSAASKQIAAALERLAGAVEVLVEDNKQIGSSFASIEQLLSKSVWTGPPVEFINMS